MKHLSKLNRKLVRVGPVRRSFGRSKATTSTWNRENYPSNYLTSRSKPTVMLAMLPNPVMIIPFSYYIADEQLSE